MEVEPLAAAVAALRATVPESAAESNALDRLDLRLQTMTFPAVMRISSRARPARPRTWALSASVALLAALGFMALSPRIAGRGRANASLATGADARTALRLPDGTLLELDHDTVAVVTSGWWSRQVRLERGRILVHAAHQSLGRRLRVATADFELTVVGTEFAVTSAPQGSRVSVAEGIVSVATGATEHHAVGAGQQFATSSRLAPVTVAEDVNWVPMHPALATAAPAARQALAATTPSPSLFAAASSIPPPTAAPIPIQVAPALAAPNPTKAQAQTQTQSQTPTAPPESPAQLLFREARASVAELSQPEGRPFALREIAAQELPNYPQQALRDFAEAFRLAVAIRTAGGDFHFYLKQEAELGSINELMRAHQTAAALALARQSDVGRGLIYNPILPSVANNESPEAAIALMRECQRADGTFPYSGATTVAANPKTSIAQRREILHLAYSAAAAETNIIASQTAVAAMVKGHELDPALDAELETTLQTLLRRFNSQPAKAQNVGRKLLALLQTIDPAAAQQLTPEMPTFASPAPAPLPLHHTFNSDGTLSTAFGPDPGAAAAQLAPTDPAGARAAVEAINDTSARFTALVAIAEAMQAAHPREAETDADDALTLTSPEDFLAAGDHAITAAQLAGVFLKLGRDGDASALAGRCLQQAEALATTVQQKYHDADAAGRLSFAMPFSSSAAGSSGVIRIFQLAAAADFPLAAERARALNSDLLRPYVLAYVAGQAP